MFYLLNVAKIFSHHSFVVAKTFDGEEVDVPFRCLDFTRLAGVSKGFWQSTLANNFTANINLRESNIKDYCK